MCPSPVINAPPLRLARHVYHFACIAATVRQHMKAVELQENYDISTSALQGPRSASELLERIGRRMTASDFGYNGAILGSLPAFFIYPREPD